ncbi:MAG TPA: hypothetical protein VNS22_27240 [Geminicoccus sp.]|uniref:hypothetical protein n=1 Tax=Geminicoccus sp. TaxID=2024832 RepID=UPI002C13C157|nr:hypothetical protein [Geminicoccus sp.]HWL72054.1 hypothetical protein [Geminicoccus sp.]
MAVFWITFRIEGQEGASDYNQKYVALQAVWHDITPMYWAEPTSFVIFEAETTIDILASKIRNAINPKTDVVLIRENGKNNCRIVGQWEDDAIFSLMPGLKK